MGSMTGYVYSDGPDSFEIVYSPSSWDSPISYKQDTPVSSGLSVGVITVMVIFATLVTMVKIFLLFWCYARRKEFITHHSIKKEFITQTRNQVAGRTIQIHNLKGCANKYPEQHISETSMEKFLNEMVKEKPIRFSQQQLEVFTQRFAKVLGSGGFGIVYKGHLPHGVRIAVKVLHGSGGKRMEQQFMAEVGTIGRTYHVNLVRLYGFCFQPTMRALVYEYMENGSLDNFLFKSKSPAIEWRNFQKIAVGTAKGIEYLHHGCQQRIIHYDIKPGNVLLDRNLNPKVSDFGLAKLCDKENTHIDMSGYRGTPGYAAPELYVPYHVTHKCDVYSFGMLLFEIVGRRKNYDPKLSGQSREWLPKWTYNKYMKNNLEDMILLNNEIATEEEIEETKRMVIVALWCVQYLPATRPTMSSVVKMLEGGIEIPPPPNPFIYLEDYTDANADRNCWSNSEGDTIVEVSAHPKGSRC